MEVMFKNMMEIIVMEQIDEVIEQLGSCKCDQCKMDIASYALNRLPPKYVATTTGEVLVKMDSLNSQFKSDVTAAIVTAIKVISRNPHHKG